MEQRLLSQRLDEARPVPVRGGHMEDQQIIELYWRRSEDAIWATQSKYGGYCGAIAQNILSNPQDEEECLNDTWIGAWNAMPPHRPNRLRLFLGKITRSLACDALRSRNARKRGGGASFAPLEELAECVPAASGTEEAVEAHELERIIGRFLHGLAERDCSLFLRRYWYAEPLERIAERYGLKVNTVKTSLFRTRRKLKDYLEKEGIVL